MDIKEVLESEEGKAAIEAIIEEKTKPLVAKRDELLGKLKEKSEKLTVAEQAALDAAEAKAKAEEEAVMKSGDVEKIKTQLEEKYTKELDKSSGTIAELESRLTKEVLDRGLTDALSKAGVKPEFIEDLRISMKSKHTSEVTQDGAMLDGKPISEYVTEWAQSDQGKHYLAAPDNGGGGTNGANGGGKAKTVKADLSGDKASRVAALNNRYPELQQKGN